HLLSGMAWETARDTGMNALGLPDNPRPMLGELAAGVDAAYRELAARLGDDTPASVDEDGKLHVAALSAVVADCGPEGGVGAAVVVDALYLLVRVVGVGPVAPAQTGGRGRNDLGIIRLRRRFKVVVMEEPS
ncbi:hypothetical protein, partial [Nocardia cyriacigeorgica]|uniref:hypothetical protein n=1 Tax=Nocardia cyriacigeorgica TaxID=135487 RepID=UPI002458032B